VAGVKYQASSINGWCDSEACYEQVGMQLNNKSNM